MRHFLAFSAAITLLVACGEEPASAECAGYALTEGQTAVEKTLPEGRVIDVNGDDLPDTLIDFLKGGSELHLNCGDDKSATILRSGARLVAQKTEGPWQAFELSYVGDRSVTLGETIYRFDMLPLKVTDFQEPRIVFNGGAYGANLPLCDGLNVRAPLYSNIKPDGDVEAELADMSVEFGGENHAIRIKSKLI